MIKVSHSSLVECSESNLDEIARKHLSKVNPRSLKTNKPVKRAIFTKITTFKNEVDSDDYLNQHCNGDELVRKRHSDFLNYFIEQEGFFLDSLITASPKLLKSIIEDVEDILCESDFIVDGVYTELYKKTKNNLFSYSNYRNTKGCIEVYEALLGANTFCLYCNSVPLDIISKERHSKNNLTQALFDLDHFYLRSKYPYLSLCFYNLIPCCHSCNSSIRGPLDFDIETHINPYLTSFDEHYKFSVDEIELTQLILGADKPITNIKVNKIDSSERNVDRTIEDLLLIERSNLEVDKINNLGCSYIRHKDRKISEPELFVELIYGYEYIRIPSDRKYIHKHQHSKLQLDFIEQIECSTNT
ncbi:hypothetical protein BCU90_24210 [Vibrio lentus]|uniref:hypothetical protein n=1 Tax=Vibrio lentus TaxID=136468 RepID=UPI000C85A0EF|nr:hypothetical protein [Vibrio lentus]PMG42605.1 hypothetical protein BCU90_24210 [Vibrio lentus]